MQTTIFLSVDHTEFLMIISPCYFVFFISKKLLLACYVSCTCTYIALGYSVYIFSLNLKPFKKYNDTPNTIFWCVYCNFAVAAYFSRFSCFSYFTARGAAVAVPSNISNE